jgi:hypothetical protein
VDATRTKLLAADVSLGVVSLGIATWLVLSRPEKEAPSDSAWKLQAAPLVGGGYAGVSRSF